MKNPFEHIPNSELSLLIDEWIKSERNRKLLKRRLIDGITVEKIAEEFNISVTRTKEVIEDSVSLLKAVQKPP
jgi:DNA-directed RNA polymerase sigma subunit (sigma70/sigma32)